jgi:hypothetical protein
MELHLLEEMVEQVFLVQFLERRLPMEREVVAVARVILDTPDTRVPHLTILETEECRVYIQMGRGGVMVLLL